MSINSKYSKTFLVALCSLVYFVSYFSRKNFAAVVAGMIESSVIDKVTAGFVGMGLFIAYGVGQLISGYLGDKIKPKYLILAGLGTTALCNALMPLVGRAGLMIAVWSVNGFAQAMLWPPIVRILADNLTHERFVRANLAVTTAAHVATVLLYLYVPVCIKFFSWETVFATATVMAVIAMLVFIISISLIIPSKSEREEQASAPEKEEVKSESDSCYVKLLAKSGIFYIFFSIIMMGFLRDGIESWLPMLYSEAFGKDVSESTLVSVILPIFSIISITVVTALHKKGLFRNEVSGSALLFGMSLLSAVPLAFFVAMDGTFFGVMALLLTAFICAAMH